MPPIKTNHTHKKIIELVIIFLFGTISFTWFRGYPFLFGVDTGLPLNLRSYIDEYLYAWSWHSAYGGGDVAKFSFLLPLGFFLKLYALSTLPFSPSIFQKFLVYIIFTFSGISAYFLLITLRPNSSFSARLFAASLYMFNFYNLLLWSPLPYILIVYTFFPLILALYIRGIREEKGLAYAIITSLMWTVTITPGYGKPFVVTNWFVIFSFLIFYVITTRNKENAKKAFYFTFYLTASWLALNALWIVPLSLRFRAEALKRSVHSVSSWILFEHNSVIIMDGLRFMGYYKLTSSYKGSPLFPWYDTYNSPFFTIISFLIPILAFSSLIVNKKDKNSIYFSIFTIFFLILVKGPNPPFGSLNTLIFSKFGLYLLFRSVYARFMGYVVLGSTILIAFTIDELAKLKVKSKKLKVKRKALDILKGLLIALTFISLVGVLPHPLWTGSLYDQSEIIPSKRIEVPNYYYEAAKWLEDQQGGFNILPLPFRRGERGKLPLFWNNGTNGYLAKYPFLFLSSKRFIIEDFGNQTASTLVHYLNSGAIKNSLIFNIFNIKYIIFHRDANWKYLEGIINDPKEIQLSLNSMDGLRLEKSFGKIDIYKNIYWKPTHAYSLLSKSLEGLTKELGINEVSIYFRDDFEYNFPLKWNYIKGNWELSNKSKNGRFSVKGKDDDSSIAPSLRLTKYIGEKIYAKKMVTEAWFMFGENTLYHFPFILRVESRETFYPIITKKNGHFGYYNKSHFPIDKCYNPNRWYNIKIKYDIEQGVYWIWIDNELITPDGLPIFIHESKQVVSPSENFVEIMILAGEGKETGATMWIDGVRIWDQKSEDLISRYTSAANLIKNCEIIRLNKINPTLYKSNIEIAQPLILIFNEKYDEGWIAEVNGKKYNPFNAFGFANGYLINETGNLKIIIEYKPQKWFYYGVIVSGAAFLTCIIYLYLTYNWTKNKKLGKI